MLFKSSVKTMNIFSRVSFLTILDIYKDYFKGHHRGCKNNTCICVTRGRNCSSSSFSLKKLLHLYAKGYVIKEFHNLYCWWTKELCSQHLLQIGGVSRILGSVHHWLVMYWDSCIERRDCHYNTSLIRYWDKGSIVGWYFGIGQRVW